MDQSRQGKSKRVKSQLNLFRESIVFVASFILWLYCATVLLVLVGSLIPYENHFIQIIRAILNIEKGEIISILYYFVGGSIIIFVYFLLTYFFNVRKRRALPYGKP